MTQRILFKFKYAYLDSKQTEADRSVTQKAFEFLVIIDAYVFKDIGATKVSTIPAEDKQSLP